MSSDTTEYETQDSSESSQIEKRRYVRVPVEFTALIRQDRRLYSGMALNLSEDGLFLLVPELLSPSQTVHVTFRLPNAADETQVPARIAWSSKVKGRGKFVYGIGVQITSDVCQGGVALICGWCVANIRDTGRFHYLRSEVQFVITSIGASAVEGAVVLIRNVCPSFVTSQ